MTLVTETAMLKLRQEIVDRHDLMVIMLFGEEAVPPQTLLRLKKRGYSWPVTFTPGPVDAFQFGQLAAQFQRFGKRVPLSLNEFKKAKAANPIPLTAEERAAIDSITRDLILRIKNLGDKVSNTTGEIIASANKTMRLKTALLVQQELRSGIARRNTLKDVTIKLRQATKDYATDYLRIAATELNNAYQEGRLYNIRKANKGKDPLVFKQPRPDCCSECSSAYLDGKRPRLFRLSELLAHGSNVGRRKSERLPVLESHHPFCRCELHELPMGFTFDDDGNMLYEGIK